LRNTPPARRAKPRAFFLDNAALIWTCSRIQVSSALIYSPRRVAPSAGGEGVEAVFGTPISGALFGIEVLYLGHLEYALLFPCLVSGIVAHFVSGVRAPAPAFHDALVGIGTPRMFLLSIGFGMAFGLIALLLIGDLTRSGLRIHPGSLTDRVHRMSTSRSAPREEDESEEP